MKKKEKEITLLAKYGTYKCSLLNKKLYKKTLHQRRERKKRRKEK